jgi:hypothetical protein
VNRPTDPREAAPAHARPQVARFALAGVVLGLTLGSGPLWLRSTHAQDKPPKDPSSNQELGKQLQKAIETINNESASLRERESAIQQAAGMTSGDNYPPARREEVRKALDTLLRQLGSKQPRPSDQEELAAHTFSVISMTYKSFPDLSKIAQPFLAKPAADKTRVQVLRAVELLGAPGLGPDLIAIISQPYLDNRPARDKAREKLEPLVVRATWGLPGNEAIEVLAATVNKSQIEPARRAAIKALGNFVIRRRPSDYKRDQVIAVLKEVAKLKNTAAILGSYAAQALLRHNSWEGMPPVMERLGSKYPQACDYEAVCVAAQRPDGFAGVTPKAFDVTPGATRDEACAAAKDWWAGAQKSTPENVALDALAAEGKPVPKNPAAKDYLGALIDGLAANNYPLRKTVLDIFVQKTGRTDFAQKFLSLHEEGGSASQKILIDSGLDETIEGDPAKLRIVMTQQEERSRKLHAAWDKVKDKATYDNGYWSVPWEPEGSGPAKTEK